MATSKKIKIVKSRENGEHDVLITLAAGETLTFEGGWHEISEEGKCLAIWSYLHPIYGYRETWVKMTNREMERINREYCGLHNCCCGSGIGVIDSVINEPGNWWVFHDTDETREIVAEALDQFSEAY